MMEGYPSSAYYVLKPELNYKKRIVYVPDFLLTTSRVLIFPPDME